MYNKIYNFVIGIICIIVIIACTQTNTRKGTTVSITDGKIAVSDDFKQTVNLQIGIGEAISFSKEVKVNKDISLLSLLKSNKKYHNDIALLLAQNNGDVSMKIKIEEVFDTILTFHLDIKGAIQHTTKVTSGNCAHLIGLYNPTNVEGDIIKWLYRKNQKNVGEETINNMRLYLQELNRTDYNEYLTKDEIPIITSFKGINYMVKSNLVADNYYLFACKTEKELEDFVEEMVSIKFDGASHTLNKPLPCYRGQSSSGNICIFLVGINNNWNYRIEPIGLVCIDNEKPIAFGEHMKAIGIPVSELNDIIFSKNRIKIKMPENVPRTSGYAFLETRNWGGDGISANVNFSVLFGGDVKSITLERSGNLARWVGKGKLVLDLQGKQSPYIFTYELHLEHGDNYVPVTVTDLRGNKTEYKFNVACVRSKDNTPDININNNVDVNVW